MHSSGSTIIAWRTSIKYLFYSDCGNALGAAIKVKSEGGQVALWTKDPKGSSIGKGLVDSIYDWKLTPDEDTINVFDTTNFGHMADLYRLGGLPVVGGSMIADRLEMDRGFAKKIMAEAGINTPKSKMFKDWESGKAYVASRPGVRLALKPGEILSGNLPSHCADKKYPTADLTATIEHYSRSFAGDPEYEIQDFVEGIDLSTAAWFDGDDWLEPAYHTREVKAINDGNRGATTGCAGNIMWPCDDWVLRETLHKLRNPLRQLGYVGLFDINCIVNAQERKVYGLEFTPREGFDSEPAIFTIGLTSELGKFLADFALGQATELPMKDGYTAGVRMTIPPHPSDIEAAPAGLPVLGITEKDLSEYIYAYDLMLSSEKRIVTAGAYGLIGVVCAHGDDPRATMQAATDRCKEVRVSEAQYRLDLADVFTKDLEDLGFLKGESKPEAEPVARPAEKRMNRLFPKRS